ncbi:MAG: GatB/YqeY domain-containing protein [Gammaproteobacteria bacterium]|nr:GatB/YqeY domain-containing protein [Gammaproteobacteria bacterium]
MTLKVRIQDDLKAAMRAKEKARVGAFRLLTAAIKQREVDGRIELDDAAVVAVIEKLIKQGRDAASQFEAAGRDELAAKEQAEIALYQSYLPEPLDPVALQTLIDQAITTSGADGMRDMGKVMALLKPQVQGRVDMAALSSQIKQRLTGA